MKKKADRQALQEFAKKVKKTNHSSKLDVVGDYRSQDSQTPKDPHFMRIQENRVNTLNTIEEQEVDNENSPGLRSIMLQSEIYPKADSDKREAKQIKMQVIPRQKQYCATGLQSRASPRSGRYQICVDSPSTISDLRFIPGRATEVSNFSNLCQSFTNTSNFFNPRKSKETNMDSFSPGSMARIGRSDARLMDDYMTVQGFGSPSADNYRQKVDRLEHENDQLRQSNEAYKQEISMLACRIESLASRINMDDDLDDDICHCRCARHAQEEIELRKLRAKVATLEMMVRGTPSIRSWTDLKREISAIDDRDKSREKFDDIATSRLTNRAKDVEKAKARVEEELSTIYSKYEIALKEIALFKNSSQS